MKKLISKWLSVFFIIAFCMIAVIMTPVSTAYAAGIITNAGFENMTSFSTAGDESLNWIGAASNYAAPVIVSSGDARHGNAHEGTKFAAIPAGTSTYASIRQTITGLSPSTYYVISGYIKNEAGSSAFSVGVRYFDPEHANVTSEYKVISNSQAWTYFKITFMTGPTNTQAGILAVNNSAAGFGYIDDLSITAVTQSFADLSAAVGQAKTLAERDYTEATWSVFAAALAQAEAKLSDPAASDSELESALNQLQASITGLQEAIPPESFTSPGNITYYVSSSQGSDNNDGLSPERPWKTVDKVNAGTYAAGDNILFRSGDSWTGTILHPLGSGVPGNPIVLGRYGVAAEKPYFNAEDASITMNINNFTKVENSQRTPGTQTFYATVYLYNQEYWTIEDIEVSNRSAGYTNAGGDGKLRNGIMIMNDGAGTLHDIAVKNTYVHDVLGDKSSKAYWGGAGINYTVMLKGEEAHGSNYEGILIEGNYVRNTNRQGIVTNSRQNLREDMDHTGELQGAISKGISPWYPSTDVQVRNNYVKDIAGDGILVQVCTDAIVEYNTVDGFNQRSGGASCGIWAWNADDTVFQYNEAFGGKTTQDGQGYDIDYGQTGTIYQYNYSHDNDGGFILVCSPGQGNDVNAPGYGVKCQNGIIRYNISQNDRNRIFMFSGYSDGTVIYNNTLYQGRGINASPINFWAWNTTYPTSVSFYNNIFYLASAGSWNYSSSGVSMQGMVFDYNTIYGIHSSGEPQDAHKLTDNPLLADPGTGTTNTAVGGAYAAPGLDGYKLMEGSPAIGSGKIIETASGRTFNGLTANGGQDYYGNAVPAGQAPNRGAYNGPAVEFDPDKVEQIGETGGGTASQLLPNGGFESGDLTSWSQWPSNTVVYNKESGYGTAYEGNYFAAFKAGSNLNQTVAGLTSGKHYIVLGNMRNDPGVTKFYVGLRYFDSNHDSVIENEKVYSSSTDWTRFSIIFKMGSDKSSVGILAQNMDPSGDGKGYLDNVQLYELSDARRSILASLEAANSLAEGNYAQETWNLLQSTLLDADRIFWDFTADSNEVEETAQSLIDLMNNTKPSDCPASYYGYQIRTREGNTYDLRLLGVINTLEADEVGYVYSYIQTNPVIENSNKVSSNIVYRSIMADSTAYTAQELGGEYIIACTVSGLSDETKAAPLYVRVYVTKDGTTTYTEIKTITVN
ncbi:hypothetical protein HNQ56_002881 [Anaerotaenia torta]|uniref:carbohydrate binding domain-containing protein n=1 Tax=Anaerotaenia torta TaxID=433293 RepID=UPI003D1B2B5D